MKRTRSEFVHDLKIGGLGVILAHIILVVMLAIFASGCATTSAQQSAIEQIRTQETLHGLVKVSQMGNDCTDQMQYLRDIIKEVYFRSGLPEPAIVKLTPLSGSSICGVAQGMANLVAMPEFGGRNTAVAEVELYWSSITERELLYASAILASMRPL